MALFVAFSDLTNHQNDLPWLPFGLLFGLLLGHFSHQRAPSQPKAPSHLTNDSFWLTSSLFGSIMWPIPLVVNPQASCLWPLASGLWPRRGARSVNNFPAV